MNKIPALKKIKIKENIILKTIKLTLYLSEYIEVLKKWPVKY